MFHNSFNTWSCLIGTDIKYFGLQIILRIQVQDYNYSRINYYMLNINLDIGTIFVSNSTIQGNPLQNFLNICVYLSVCQCFSFILRNYLTLFSVNILPSYN